MAKITIDISSCCQTENKGGRPKVEKTPLTTREVTRRLLTAEDLNAEVKDMSEFYGVSEASIMEAAMWIFVHKAKHFARAYVEAEKEIERRKTRIVIY